MSFYEALLIGGMIGAGIGCAGLFMLMGPAARTWMTSYILSKPMILLPHENKYSEFKTANKIDKEGNYHFKDRGKTRVAVVDRDDVSIASKKLPFVTILDKYDMSVSPDKAKLAEWKKVYGKNPKLEWGGTSISWNKLEDKIGKILHGPLRVAALYAAAIETNRPLPGDKKFDGASAMKIVAILGFVAIAAVGIYIAYSMGYI